MFFYLFYRGMNLLVSVQAAMGKESLIGFREDK